MIISYLRDTRAVPIRFVILRTGTQVYWVRGIAIRCEVGWTEVNVNTHET